MMHNLLGFKEVRMLQLFLVLTSLSFLLLGFQIGKFEEFDIGCQPSKFQCFRLSLSNLTEWGEKHPSPVLQQDKKIQCLQG